MKWNIILCQVMTCTIGQLSLEVILLRGSEMALYMMYIPVSLPHLLKYNVKSSWWNFCSLKETMTLDRVETQFAMFIGNVDTNDNTKHCDFKSDCG